MNKAWKYKRRRKSAATIRREDRQRDDASAIKAAGRVASKAKARSEKAGQRHLQACRTWEDTGCRVFSSQQSPGVVRARAWMRL